MFKYILLSIILPVSLNLSGSDLRSAKFIKANLKGANLTYVNAEHANFQEAILDEADLSYGNFQYAFFEKASLVDVKAKEADFRHSEGLSIETINNLEKQGARFH